MHAIVGADYLQLALTKLVQQYVDIFNDRWKGRRNQAHEPSPPDDADEEYRRFVEEARRKFGGQRREWNTKHNTLFAGMAIDIEPTLGTHNHGFFEKGTVTLD